MKIKKVFIALILLMFCFVGSVSASEDLARDITANAQAVAEPAFGQTSTGGTYIYVIVGNIIRVVVGLLGVIMLVIIVYAGFLWMTAGGSEADYNLVSGVG